MERKFFMVIILRGVSGSGKSTLSRFMMSDGVNGVDQLVNNSEVSTFMWHLYDTSPGPKATFSADSYFMRDGEYRFDHRDLSVAHGLCLKGFAEAIRSPPSGSTAQTLVVDNTNCSVAEVAPYAALAAAYSHELHVVTLIGDPKTCWKRGHHGVPFSGVLRQDTNLRRSLNEWPPWYQQQVFPA